MSELKNKAVRDLILFVKDVRIPCNRVSNLDHQRFWGPARSLAERALRPSPSL